MKTVVVTGCDYGLGAELVKRGLADGWRVFACGLNPAKTKPMRELARAYGKQLEVLRMDMSSESAIRRGAAVIRRRIPRLDLLVNNAGVYWTDGAEQMSFRSFQRMFAVNTIGPAVLVRELLKPLRAARGRIVNVSSESGSLAGVTNGRPIIAYGASKAALNMVMRRLSFILADDGIRILCVHPGWMRTPMGKLSGDPDQEPATTAKEIFELAGKLDATMSGGFLDHDGHARPW